jgi:hypothetical protein
MLAAQAAKRCSARHRHGRQRPLGTTSITLAGSSRPFNRSTPRSSKRMPSIRRASETTVSLVRISPGAARLQSRAARFRAPPGSRPRQGPPRLHRGRSRPRAPGPVCRPFAPGRAVVGRPRRGSPRVQTRNAERLVAAQLEAARRRATRCPVARARRSGRRASPPPRLRAPACSACSRERPRSGRSATKTQRRRRLASPRRSSLPRHARAKGTRSPCERKGRVWLLYVSAGSRAAPARCAFRRKIAFVCSCDTRDSVTPSTSPISRSVSSS